jgi:hypothetical protein
MELSCLPPRSIPPGCGKPRERACGVASEACDDVVLALNEAATNATLSGSRGGQPVQVVVHVNDNVIQASVLDLRARPADRTPNDADTDALSVRGRGLCLAGWWTRCGLSASGSDPRDAGRAIRPARPLAR